MTLGMREKVKKKAHQSTSVDTVFPVKIYKVILGERHTISTTGYKNQTCLVKELLKQQEWLGEKRQE